MAFRELGINIEIDDDIVTIFGKGLNGLSKQNLKLMQAIQEQWQDYYQVYSLLKILIAQFLETSHWLLGL